MNLLSIITPCFNEEQAIRYFYKEIKKISEDFSKQSVNFELIFVDDGSTDNTLNIIKQIRKEDKTIRYISFSRNFGKEAAIYAGLEHSKGDYVVIMDADLQDPPSYLEQMYKAITEEGYDSAATRRVTRKGEPMVRSFFARQFYKLIVSVKKSTTTKHIKRKRQKIHAYKMY